MSDLQPYGVATEDSEPDTLRGISAMARYAGRFVDPQPTYRAVYGWIAKGLFHTWDFGGMKHASKAQIRAALAGRDVDPANVAPDPEPIPQHVNGSEPSVSDSTPEPITESRLERLKRIKAANKS